MFSYKPAVPNFNLLIFSKTPKSVSRCNGVQGINITRLNFSIIPEV